MVRLVIALGIVNFGILANSSSPEAWNQFRADVQTKCLERFFQQHPTAKSVSVLVDPFGGDKVGVAHLKAKETKDYYLCLYDKRAKVISTFLGLGDIDKPG